MGKIFKINGDRMEEFQAKITKLNRRAVKLGVTPAVFTVVQEHRQYLDFAGNKCTVAHAVRVQTQFEIDLTGEAPKFEGWEFLGKIEKMAAGNLLSAVPGKEVPEAYRDAAPECDHCQTRRRRKFTYIVRHDDGTVKQVGHQCIRDFLGHQSPEWIAQMCEIALSFAAAGDDEGLGGWSRPIDATHILTVVAMATACARLRGWVSSKSERQSTISEVQSQLFNRMHLKPKEIVTPTAADNELAITIAEWARALPTDPSNQFLTNLKIVCSEDLIKARHIGLACAAYIAYDKFVGDPSKFKSDKVEIKNEHFGEIKKREVFELTVVEARKMMNDFGESTLVKFLDKDNRMAIWFASGRPDLEVGDKIKAKATVKAHSDYKGLAQTMLNRVAVQNNSRFPAVEVSGEEEQQQQESV